MIGFGQLNYLEKKWSLEGGVTYEVIVDEIIDAKDDIITVSIPKLSLAYVKVIVKHKDGKTRFTFKDFETGGNNTGALFLSTKKGNKSYDWFMIKKGKWRKWMKKYGKTDIANYLEKNIEKIDDGWE